MRRDVDAALAELAAKRFGVVGWAEARRLGAGAALLRRRVNAGVFDEASPRSLVLRGSPDTFERRATIARFDAGPGSGLSVMTAAAVYGVAGFDREPIHVSRPRRDDRRPREGVVWHHPRLLPPHHLVDVNGLVLTTPARTLADLLGLREVHTKRAERALDSARSARLVNHAQLRQMADEWCERGRPGSGALRDYLERKPADWVAADSNVARRFIHLVIEAGMPEPRSEVNVGDVAAWLGRVDCLDPELPLIAEIDSERFHAAPLDADADEGRDERLRGAGFEVVRFTENEVWYKPRDVVDRWRQRRRQLLRRRAS